MGGGPFLHLASGAGERDLRGNLERPLSIESSGAGALGSASFPARAVLGE